MGDLFVFYFGGCVCVIFDFVVLVCVGVVVVFWFVMSVC